eukprot:scaffold218128_cov18-Prasinocladus_malaysianus.AAC.1
MRLHHELPCKACLPSIMAVIGHLEGATLDVCKTMQGQGKLVQSDGTTYMGAWVSDLQEGPGQCVYASGEKYSGDWIGGKRHGQGKCVLSNGNKWAYSRPNRPSG